MGWIADIRRKCRQDREARKLESFKKEADRNIYITRMDNGVDYIMAFGYPVSLESDANDTLRDRLDFIKRAYIETKMMED